MTLTTLLSARIRDLESRAAPLPDYQEELAEIEERRQQLHASIEGAQAAAYQLELIGLHAEQVLNGTTTRVEITGGEEPLDEPTPEPEEAPKVPDVEPVEPVVVDTAPAEPEPESNPADPLDEEAPPPTARERIIAYLTEHPGRSAVEVAEGADLKLATTASQLSLMHRSSLLIHDGGKPMRYSLRAVMGAPAPVEHSAAPEPTTSELAPDQQAILDIMSDGALYSEMHLQKRTNWAQTRIFRAVQALVMRDLVQKRAGQFELTPKEQRATA